MFQFNIRNRNRRNLLLTAALLLVVSLLIASCGSGAKTAANQSSIAVAPEEAPEASAVADFASGESRDTAASTAQQAGIGESKGGSKAKESATAAALQKDRKMIMDGNVSMETLKFDSSIDAMDELIKSCGGFAETRTVRGKSNNSRALRSATYVIRVPAESFESILKDMGNIGTVLESTSEGTDITDSYYDSETRVKTLKVQEQTLLDILSKAEKLEDVITLETRLSEIRYEIESIENTLKNYDRLVAFSRIQVFIQEVDDVTETRPVEKKLNERISGAFSQSLREFRIGFEDFVVWLAASWITILFLAVLAAILLIILSNRRRKKNTAYQPPNAEIKTENKENKE